MLYTEKPEIFNPKFDVVSCFVEYQNEILLLLRQDYKSEPNTYGVPAGKVEKDETINSAMIRELQQETNLENIDMQYYKKVYVKYPTYDFVYHMYHAILEKQPEIKINPEEHKKFIWKNPLEALKESLIQDLDTCIKMYYKI